MPNTGYRGAISYGNEPTTKYGSTVTVNKDLGMVQSVDPTENNSVFKLRKLGGTRDYASLIAGKFEVSGSFEYYLQDGKFLRMAFGEDTGVSTTDGGPRTIHASGATGTTYHHVLGSAESPGVNSFPSFTMEVSDDEGTGTANFIRKYNGGRVDNITVSGEVDNPVMVSVDYVAQNVVISSASRTSVTAQTEDPFVFYQGGIYIAPAKLATSVMTGTVGQLNSFEFSLSNNMEPSWFINRGTTNPWENIRCAKYIIPKGRDMEAKLEFNFQNKSQYQRFLGSSGATEPSLSFTKPEIVIDLVRGGGPGAQSTSASNDWMRLQLSSVIFEDASIPLAPEDVVSETYSVFVKSAKLRVLDDISSY